MRGLAQCLGSQPAFLLDCLWQTARSDGRIHPPCCPPTASSSPRCPPLSISSRSSRYAGSRSAQAAERCPRSLSEIARTQLLHADRPVIELAIFNGIITPSDPTELR